MNLFIEQLEISLKEFHLHCNNLSFNAGDIVLLTASNGSGKTTFLKGIIGLVNTNHRKIKLNGKDVTRINLAEPIAAYIGEEFLIPFYEPLEYFELIGKIKGLEKSQIRLMIESVGDLFRLKWPKKYINELSTGMRKKVGLAGSLIGDPQIILWDEPFENVDDEAQSLLKGFIKNEKRLVIYSSPVNNDLPFTGILTIQSGKVLMENQTS
ncbi:MAG: ATP-binding cassette domain-containing protein [Cytophagales bacterium]|nr:ATP-binding cassette domain-containing protein [Cytophagales bacterium]